MANEPVKVNTSKFDSTFGLYVRLNKRELPNLINKVGYEVSKLCVVKTASVPKDQIKASLQQASRTSPTMTVGQVITNKLRTAKGEPALYGTELAASAKRFERYRASTGNFLRSGFIPGAQAFERVVKDKSSRSIKGVRIYGRPKGGGSVAPSTPSWNPKASIWNSVQGGVHHWFNAPARDVGKVQAILEQGVQGALNTKEADMQIYIEKKLNPLIKDFNNS